MPLYPFRFLVGTVSVVLLFSGCFKAPSPDVELRELRIQAEDRLLQDARLAFLRSDYREAVLLLDRFLANHPASPRTDEARWWLARSYQQQGKLPVALRYFKALAQSRTTNPYQVEAKLLVKRLEKSLGITIQHEEVKGLLVSAQEVIRDQHISAVIRENARVNGNALLINLECPTDSDFHNASSPVDKGHQWRHVITKQLRPFVTQVMPQGHAIYVRLSLRCLGQYQFDQGSPANKLKDWAYNPKLQRVRPSPYYSLFSSAYQTAVVKLLTDLSKLGIAGMIFRSTPPFGPFDGLSPIAVKTFERAFMTSFDPVRVFKSAKPVVRTSESRSFGADVFETRELPHLFWKWAGWKARERLRIMNELIRTMRVQFPHLQFGMELHAESIQDPVSALVNVGEDWIEAAHSRFDFFVSRLAKPGKTMIHATSRNGTDPESSYSIIQQMVQYLDDPKRVWVILPDDLQNPRMHSLKSDYERLPEGIGKIYELSPIP